MDEIVLPLLSGLVGALIATISTIFYTEYKDRRKQKLSLAREKLEKVYGPLVALRKKIDSANVSGGGFLVPRSETEKEMVEKIIFDYYPLIDDDLKEDIVLLHPEISAQDINKFKAILSEVEEKIIKHYNENRTILGLE